MQLLVIDRDNDRQNNAVLAGLEVGLFAMGTDSLQVAEEVLTRLHVDLLLADASTLDDALGDLLGLAEERNSTLRTVLLSADVTADLSELAGAFPALAAVVDPMIEPGLALRLGLPFASRMRLRDGPARSEVPVWRRPARLEQAA